MKLQDIRTFLSDLTTFYDSGIPVRTALESLASQHRGAIGQYSGRLAARITAGAGLAEAMRSTPGELPPAFIAVIEAGERSGEMPDMLRALVNEIERRLEISRMLLTSLLYPMFILVLGCLLPPLFLIFKGELGTYILLECLTLGPLAALVGGGIWVYRSRLRRPGLFRRFAAIVGAIPVIGGSVRNIAIGQALQLFGMLLEAGLSLHEVIPLVRSSTSFPIVTRLFDRVEIALRKGEPVTSAFEDEKIIPDSVRVQMHTGELSGTLGQALQHGGKDMLEASWRMLDRLAKLLPVFLIIALGIFILIVALNFLGKLYDF